MSAPPTTSFASQFQRHFLILGFKGGAIGGGVAILLFGLLEAAKAWLAGTPEGDEVAGLVRQSFHRRRRLFGDRAANRVHGLGDGVRLAPHRQRHARSPSTEGVDANDRLLPDYDVPAVNGGMGP